VKIKFIGTGSGQTSLKRFHSSLLITSSDNNLLVDCGDGISKALLNQKIDFNLIDSILISHFHSDHFSGLPSLLTQMKLISRKKDLTIFVHSSEKNFLENFIFHSYLFKERMTFELKIIPFNDEIEIKVSENFSFFSRINSHLDKYKKYDFENKLGFIALSFLFNDLENSLIYTSDVGSEKDLYLFNQKVEWFITETTHIKSEDVLSVLEKLNPNKIILTHIGNDFEKPLTEFYRNLPETLKTRIILAFDGLEFDHYNLNCL